METQCHASAMLNTFRAVWAHLRASPQEGSIANAQVTLSERRRRRLDS